MSTHAVRVIEIGEVRAHPNAERLEIIPVGGWQAVARKGQFEPGARAIYIEPDYVVPTTAAPFAFLAKDGRETHRLRAVRLRGAVSFGLLIEVPPALAHRPVGDDVMADLGIVRWEPPMKPFKGGSDGAELPEGEWPTVFAPKYDLETLQNFLGVLAAGETVIVTEKVDGANARFVFTGGALYMGSRGRWLRPEVDHFWSRAFAATPQIEDWCRAHEGVVLYGEVYGPVQSLRYGLTEPRFVAFSALPGDGVWMDHDALAASLAAHGVPMVPLVYRGPYDLEAIRATAETDSRVGPAGHLMEGVVVVPEHERRHDIAGRVAFKLISARFWTSEA